MLLCYLLQLILQLPLVRQYKLCFYTYVHNNCFGARLLLLLAMAMYVYIYLCTIHKEVYMYVYPLLWQSIYFESSSSITALQYILWHTHTHTHKYAARISLHNFYFVATWRGSVTVRPRVQCRAITINSYQLQQQIHCWIENTAIIVECSCNYLHSIGCLQCFCCSYVVVGVHVVAFAVANVVKRFCSIATSGIHRNNRLLCATRIYYVANVVAVVTHICCITWQTINTRDTVDRYCYYWTRGFSWSHNCNEMFRI